MLVRLCTRLGERANSVYALYDGSLLALLGGGGTGTSPESAIRAYELLAKASTFARSVYWDRDGHRGYTSFTSAEFPKDTALIDVLHHASVLVFADTSQASYHKFFHASAACFLAARALAAEATPEVLLLAAGDARLMDLSSGINGARGSDLFYFLTYAIAPERLTELLDGALRSWVMAFGNDLPRSLIVSGAMGGGTSLSQWVEREANDKSSGFIMAHWLQLTERLDADARLKVLIRMFETLAPTMLVFTNGLRK